MATQEAKADATAKFYPPVELPKCPHATEPVSPDDYGDMVTIVVGTDDTDKESFFAHEGLLRHYSTYFQAALKKEWIGEAVKVIELPDDDLDTFRAFFHYMYSRKLYSCLTDEGNIPLDGCDICYIYVFGDARGAPELCNAALDLLFQKHCQEWTYPTGQLNYVYDETPARSSLRKYLVDFAAQK